MTMVMIIDGFTCRSSTTPFTLSGNFCHVFHLVKDTSVSTMFYILEELKTYIMHVLYKYFIEVSYKPTCSKVNASMVASYADRSDAKFIITSTSRCFCIASFISLYTTKTKYIRLLRWGVSTVVVYCIVDNLPFLTVVTKLDL